MNNTFPLPSSTKMEQQQKGREVKTAGAIALALSATGVFIPVVGFFMLIAAWIMSNSALKKSSDFLVSADDEKYARWANVISKVFLAFSIISLAIIIFSAF